MCLWGARGFTSVSAISIYCRNLSRILPSLADFTDMESIDALAKAVNEFEGGLVLVSHDMRLIGQVAKEIWICDNKTIEKYKGDIQNFKMQMRAQMGIGELKGDASTKAKEGADKKPEKKKDPEPTLKVVLPSKPKPAAKVVDLGTETPPAPAQKPAPIPAPASAPVPPPEPKVVEKKEEAASAVSDSSAPPRARYVPPHLRKKMQQQQQV